MKDCYCFGLATEALIGVELPEVVLFADVKKIGVITNAIPHEGALRRTGFRVFLLCGIISSARGR